jgi:hypothetical protein
MTNKTFEPVGLLDIAKQIKTNRKSVDDLEERLHSALDAKRDVASNYVEQLDSIAEKEVEVKLDPITDLIQTSAKANDAVFMAGFEAGYEKGFWKGYNKIHARTHSEQRDRELLESHGIDVDGFCDRMARMIEDHEQDIDEDEPDQHPDNYGGTK